MSSPRPAGRLPDFVVIGAMKSGTTSLYHWLGEHPSVRLPDVKEPQFFSREDRWGRGLDWYRGLFAGIGPDLVTGEFSTSYTAPDLDAVAAGRIAATVPDARLVYLLRDPAHRLRSHFVHETRRTREKRSFAAAVADPDSVYVAQSEYGARLAPYLACFPREQLFVVTLEQLTSSDAGPWQALLRHLGVDDDVPRPGVVHNVAARKSQFRGPMLWLHEHGLGKVLMAAPRPLRKLGRSVLLARPDAYRAAVHAAWTEELPGEVVARLAEDESRLRELLGADTPLWSSTGR